MLRSGHAAGSAPPLGQRDADQHQGAGDHLHPRDAFAEQEPREKDRHHRRQKKAEGALSDELDRI